LTALSLADLIPPAPAPAPDLQELLTSVPQPVAVAHKSWTSPALRNAAMVVLGLMVFSAAVYPAIRGHQNHATPERVVNSVTPLQGSIDESVGRPTRAAAAPDAKSAILGGELRRRTAPVYPPNALRNGTQGEVDLMVGVDETGVVTDTRVISGSPELANAATSAVSHWRFAPFMADGRRVAVNLPVVIAFHCSTTEDSASTQASLPASSDRQMR
jgi:TonB family protein